MDCLYCGKEVPQQTGKREKLYCNNVCKQLAYKKRKNAQKVNAPLVDGPNVVQKHYIDMLSELIELREKVYDQGQDLAKKDDQNTNQMQTIVELRQQINNQAKEITRLKHFLDVERRFLEDTKAHTFKAWLRKQPASPIRDILIADEIVPPRSSRAMYQAHVQRLMPDQMDEFIRLWKLMLLSRA